MAALNFPASSSSPWTAPNGVIYTWNADGYWEAKADPNDFDTDYLKLNATNDPVTGNLALDQDLDVGDNLAVTGTSDFTGLTTHEAGVSVTGTGSTNAIISADNSNGTDSNIIFGQHFITCEIAPSLSGNTYGLVSVFNGKNIDNSSVTTQRALRSVTGRFTEFNYPATATPIYNYFAVDCRGTGTGYAQIQTGSSTNSEVRGFFAPQSLGATPYKTYGFYSELNIDKPSAIDANAVNYNFYAKGNAPNYFAGFTSFGPDKITIGGSLDTWTTGSAAEFLHGQLKITRTVSDSNNSNLHLNRNGSNDGKLIQFYKEGAEVASIALRPAGGVQANNFNTFSLSMDSRILTNPTEITNASTTVKALQPKQEGFVAHELQQLVAEAVTGTENEEESIGTLTDYDGTVLETNVTERTGNDLTYEEQVEATPYVAAVEATYDEDGNELTPYVDEVEATYTTITRTKTWTPTGTQPVYQGVDQTKLIPLLTKALQEALERIEALEAAAGDGVKGTTRKRKS